jgi:uncharacterized membrane protein
MTPLTVIELFTGALVLIAAAAGAVAYFRVQRSEATIDILKESDSAKQRLIESQREQLADQDRKITTCQAELAAANEAVRILTATVTGKDALAHLIQQFSAFAQQSANHHNEIVELLTRRTGQ